MRNTIYDIIETGAVHRRANRLYSGAMLFFIVMSLIPLGFRGTSPALELMDKISVAVFIIDYILRLLTADIKYDKASVVSFVRYPFSPMAIIDLLSILPSLTFVNNALKALRVVRLTRLTRSIRTAKTVRAFKVVRFSQSANILMKVIGDSIGPLMLITAFTSGYVVVTALIIFNIEPQTFPTFFDALYWATVSLTTVGYGDLYAVTVPGRIISMISSFVGVAIIALPSGVITAGFVNELNARNNQ